MRSFLKCLGIIVVLGTTSCGTFHYTGDRTGSNWSDYEIQQAEEEINKVRKDVLSVLNKKQSKEYMNCYLYEVIHKYDNFESANNNLEGCTVLATKCMNQIVK